MEKRTSNFSVFFKGLMMGALVFGTIALFTAPHSGAETRLILREKGGELKDKTVSTIENVRDQVDTAISDVLKKTESAAEAVSQM